ncbi:hypothetical protein ACLKA6_001225 [Drosophila palustris]
MTLTGQFAWPADTLYASHDLAMFRATLRMRHMTTPDCACDALCMQSKSPNQNDNQLVTSELCEATVQCEYMHL